MKSIFDKMNVGNIFILTCTFMFLATIGNIVASLALLNQAKIHTVVQTYSATAEESATTADELAARAKIHSEMRCTYKLYEF